MSKHNGFSKISHGLQLQNIKTLWSMIPSLPNGDILDLGCGDGLFSFIYPNLNTHTKRTVHGIDINPKKIEQAKVVNPLYRTCNIMHLDTYTTNPYALILSTSVLHWLTSKQRQQVFNQIVPNHLYPNGIFAFTIASQGTGQDFLRSYNHIMSQETEHYNPNPVGLVTFSNFEQELNNTLLEILTLEEKQETLVYDKPGDYAKSVCIYGHDQFLQSVPKNKREKIWSRIVQHFESSLPNKQYRYVQHNIYGVMRD